MEPLRNSNNSITLLKKSKYTTSARLGGGQFGDVYKAKRKGETFAIKKIPYSPTGSFTREEVAIQQSLSHPNIVRVFEAFVDKSQSCLNVVMELCKCDLNKYLDNPEAFGYEPALDTGPWVVQLLQGLCHIHDNRVIHRDIKPENILMSYSKEEKCWSLKFTDFGQAMLITEPAMTTTYSCSPFYSAPELWDLIGTSDQKVDIWSLGIVIFQLRQKLSSQALLSHPCFAPICSSFARSIELPSNALIKSLWSSFPMKIRDYWLLYDMLAFEASERSSAERLLSMAERPDRSPLTFLLLGPSGSGKSTLFNEFDSLANEKSPDLAVGERSRWINAIFAFVVTEMVLLLLGAQKSRMKFETRAQMELAVLFLTATQNLQQTIFENESCYWWPELAPSIKQLWETRCLKALYYHHDPSICQVSQYADYLFYRIDRMIEQDYVPSGQDISKIRSHEVEIREKTFEFGLDFYTVVDGPAFPCERSQWATCYKGRDHDAMLFVVALSDYNKFGGDESVNCLAESIVQFEEIVADESFQNTLVILIFNKTDVFRILLKEVPLQQYFPDYEGGDDFDLACQFVSERFFDVFRAFPTRIPMCVHFTSLYDSDCVNKLVKESCIQIVDAAHWLDRV